MYDAPKAAAETLGLNANAKRFTLDHGGQSLWGSSAALGIINRIGLGKTRHIDTSLLWIQQTAAERRLAFEKVVGKNNPADLYTKYLVLSTSDAHVRTLDYQFVEGRSSEAPKLHFISHSWREQASTRKHIDWKWLQAITEKKGLVKVDEREAIDGLRTMGAPGNQLAGTGVQRFERRPA